MIRDFFLCTHDCIKKSFWTCEFLIPVSGLRDRFYRHSIHLPLIVPHLSHQRYHCLSNVGLFVCYQIHSTGKWISNCSNKTDSVSIALSDKPGYILKSTCISLLFKQSHNFAIYLITCVD